MKIIFYVGACVLLNLAAVAQQNGEVPEPELEELLVTSSPAYVLLGVQPENIQRPSTPRDFAGGVQSAIVNGQLQPNFAMEFNPFNWKKKQRSNQFYANDYFYSGVAAAKRNFAISIATSTSDTVVFGELDAGLGIGYGARITLIPGKVNATTRKLFSQWEDAEIRSVFINTLNSFFFLDSIKVFTDNEIDELVERNIDAIYRRQDLLDENKNKLASSLRLYANGFKGLRDHGSQKRKLEIDGKLMRDNKVTALDKLNTKKVPFDRQGFTLELSVAGVTVIQDNEWKKARHGKTALWLTPCYRLDLSNEEELDLTKSIDFMAVLRCIWNDPAVDTGDYYDIGAKFQYNRSKWNTSFEGTARYASKVPAIIRSNWTSCILIVFNYTINEMATLKFSFGSNFDGNTTTYTKPGKMFAVGGINMALRNKDKN